MRYITVQYGITWQLCNVGGLAYCMVRSLFWAIWEFGGFLVAVAAKFRCTLLHIKKALGIYRELIPRTRRIITTRVAFWDPPSGSKNVCVCTCCFVVSVSLIHGFISKEDARSKLQSAPLGTFLLRFSETNIVDDEEKDPSINGHGYLTLAVNEQDPYNGQSDRYLPAFALFSVCYLYIFSINSLY